MRNFVLSLFVLFSVGTSLGQVGTTILRENFDSYPSGSIPAGWVSYYGGDGQSGVTSSQSVSGSNSFKLSCAPSFDARFDHPLTMTVTDFLVTVFKFKGDPNTWFRPVWYVHVGNLQFGGYYDSNTGKLGWVNGSSNVVGSVVTKGNWYKVTIIYKKLTNTIDYYLNDVLQAANCSGAQPFDNVPQGITLYSANGGSGTIYYDDLSVVNFTGAQFNTGVTWLNENFDSYPSGSIPTAWVSYYGGDGQSGVTSSQSVSGSNSFKLSCAPSFDARYDRPVSVTVYDSVVTTLRFKGDPNTWFRPVWYVRVGNLQFGGYYDSNTGKLGWVNGSSNVVGSVVTKGNWYTVTIVFKKLTNTIDYYLNGKLEATNCAGTQPFAGVPEGISLYSANGGSGTIYYDDISMVSYFINPAVGVENHLQIPREFTLEQNYPNPFNPNTTIRYTLANATYVSLRIFNILGEEIATLVHERQDAGVYSLRWDALNYSSGAYFYRLQAGDFVESKKMIVSK
jgi:hypothetical protein